MLFLGEQVLDPLDLVLEALLLVRPRADSHGGLDPDDAPLVHEGVRLADELEHGVPAALCEDVSAVMRGWGEGRSRTDCRARRVHVVFQAAGLEELLHLGDLFGYGGVSGADLGGISMSVT